MNNQQLELLNEIIQILEDKAKPYEKLGIDINHTIIKDIRLSLEMIKKRLQSHQGVYIVISWVYNDYVR